MKRKLLLAGLLAAAAVALLPALDVRVYRNVRNFITEGSVSGIDWHQQAIRTVTDYANYRLWAVKGLDGKDPVSAQWWERILDYQFQAPDTITVKYRLEMPWPIGTLDGQTRFRIDESALSMDQVRMDMIDKILGVEQVSLFIAAKDWGIGAKALYFMVSIRFEPLIELLLNQDDFFTHMKLVVGVVTRNLEERCRQSDR
jgi:hypothetical protein